MARNNTAVRPKTFSGRMASQDARELAQFIALLKTERVKSYGEIGSREGDTFHAVMMSLPKGSRGVALDFPGGKWGRSTTRDKLVRTTNDLSGRGYFASCLFGDSTTPATIKQFCGRGPYDAILIDGDHCLAGVTADWTNYRSASRIIAFHDIAGTGQHDQHGNDVEVPLLWQVIKASGLRTVEFVSADSKMGIGVVWVE